jgi:membrane-bound lytic murein transglycosylase D
MLCCHVLMRVRYWLVCLAAVPLVLAAGWAGADERQPDPGLGHDLVAEEIAQHPAIHKSIDLASEHADLWIRIRNGFAMTDLNDDLVLYYQQWYQNRPDALRRMVDRSRPFMHHIVEEIEARGMPTELALLPMVESSFNPMAYSHAHASGLWQFIPATGKRFNLEQNWWHDQRRDIVASTDAALEYLQTIYDMHGDWHLALASYNWGEGAVKRAVDKNLALGLPTDYANLKMPNETRHYVPKLQALKNIFGNPVLMVQLQIPPLDNAPYFTTLAMERPIDVKTAARLANMPVHEFVALNPSHNRPVMKADTEVVIPNDRLETFQNNLENHQAPLTQWQAYTLKPGERLDRLAPRFGITLADLMRINGLHAKNRVQTGTTLLVPAGNGGLSIDDLPSNLVLPATLVNAVRAPAKPVKQTFGKPVAGKKGAAKRSTAKATGKSAGKASGKVSGKAAGNPGKAKAKNSGKAAPKSGEKASKKPPVKATTQQRNVK